MAKLSSSLDLKMPNAATAYPSKDKTSCDLAFLNEEQHEAIIRCLHAQNILIAPPEPKLSLNGFFSMLQNVTEEKPEEPAPQNINGGYRSHKMRDGTYRIHCPYNETIRKQLCSLDILITNSHDWPQYPHTFHETIAYDEVEQYELHGMTPVELDYIIECLEENNIDYVDLGTSLRCLKGSKVNNILLNLGILISLPAGKKVSMDSIKAKEVKYHEPIEPNKKKGGIYKTITVTTDEQFNCIKKVLEINSIGFSAVEEELTIIPFPSETLNKALAYLRIVHWESQCHKPSMSGVDISVNSPKNELTIDCETKPQYEDVKGKFLANGVNPKRRTAEFRLKAPDTTLTRAVLHSNNLQLPERPPKTGNTPPPPTFIEINGIKIFEAIFRQSNPDKYLISHTNKEQIDRLATLLTKFGFNLRLQTRGEQYEIIYSLAFSNSPINKVKEIVKEIDFWFLEAKIETDTMNAYDRLSPKPSTPGELYKTCREILNDYTKGGDTVLAAISRFFHGHVNRHHVSLIATKVVEIDERLANPETISIETVKELLLSIHTVTKDIRNKEGSLSRRLRYLKDELFKLTPSIMPELISESDKELDIKSVVAGAMIEDEYDRPIDYQTGLGY